jgi:hypothetical protein
MGQAMSDERRSDEGRNEDEERRARAMIDHSLIPGYGVDADPSRRPGIPRERTPQPDVLAAPPPPQRSSITVFTHGRPGKELTPVYGTAQPPAGVSGAIRALAYRYPDHFTRHWMLLLFADRVDSLEHGIGRFRALGALALLLAAGGVGYAMTRRR